MAKVYRDKRARKRGGVQPWCIDYVGLDGQRHRESTKATTKTEAQAILRKRQSQIARAEIAGLRSTRLLEAVRFQEFVESDYIPYNRRRKTEEGQKREQFILKRLGSVFGSLRMIDITAGMIQTYGEKRLDGRIGRKVKPATVNREFMCLSAIFRVAFKREVVSVNPVRRVEKYPEDNMVIRFLTEREERMLLAFAPAYVRPIVILAIHTGLRKGELLNLTWVDVDQANRILTVRKSKSGKIRHVPINDVAMEALEGLTRYMESPFVFTNPDTRTRWSDLKPAWYRGIVPAMERAGIAPLRFHDLRHTFASRLVQAGVPLNTVRELLGHSTMAMTLRYAHLAPNNLRSAVETLVPRGNGMEVGTDTAQKQVPKRSAV